MLGACFGKNGLLGKGICWVRVFEDGVLWAMVEVSGDAVGLDLYLAGVRPPAGVRARVTGWLRIAKSFDFSTQIRTYESRRIDFYKKSNLQLPVNQ
jgi:hypothetical protein